MTQFACVGLLVYRLTGYGEQSYNPNKSRARNRPKATEGWRLNSRGVRPTFTGGLRLNSGGITRDPVCIQVNTISCVDIPPHKYLCTNWSNTFGAVHNARVLRG
jgi:hypothetical protein